MLDLCRIAWVYAEIKPSSSTITMQIFMYNFMRSEKQTEFQSSDTVSSAIPSQFAFIIMELKGKFPSDLSVKKNLMHLANVIIVVL